ncbi:MAG: PilW family protein [Arenicellales bacterium]
MKLICRQLVSTLMPAAGRRQRGVTLVELMVALALGLLVTVALLKVYIDASRMYRFNEGLARLQENGRFALEFIRRDARAAGFWGCNSNATLSNVVSSTNAAFIDVAAGHIAGTQGEARANLPDSADSISFRGGFGNGSALTTAMSDASDSLSVASSAELTAPVAMISDCEDADIFSFSKDGQTVTPSAGLSKLYKTDARVHPVRQTTYCVGDSITPNVTSLKRTTDPNIACATGGDELIEGIENIQILYGEDTDAASDQVANRYVAAGTSGLDVDRIVSLRISILLRSIENNLTTTAAPYTFEGVTYTPAANDRYLRKVFTTTITLRNRVR